MRGVFGVLCLILGIAGVGCNDSNEENFRAHLSGGNEVPSRATGASGTAGFSFDGITVRYSLEVNGISAVTGAHIHSAAAAANGPIRVSLFPGPGKGNFVPAPTGALNGALVEGSFAAADVTGVSLEVLLGEMRNQTAYVNVHTSTYPSGEIRGQVRLVP